MFGVYPSNCFSLDRLEESFLSPHLSILEVLGVLWFVFYNPYKDIFVSHFWHVRFVSYSCFCTLDNESPQHSCVSPVCSAPALSRVYPPHPPEPLPAIRRYWVAREVCFL